MKNWSLWCFALLVATTDAGAQELVFARRPTQVNDVSQQTILCTLDGKRVIRQQSQLIDEVQQKLVRSQTRTLTILQVTGERPTRARIDYGTSSTKVTSGASTTPPVQIQHPIAKRSYFAELVGDKLVLRTAEGKTPSPEEEEALRRHLATFGKPNPLAKFLHGKRVPLGSEFRVPQEVARELLGLTGSRGDADTLTLKLIEIKELDGMQCGVFETILRTDNQDASMNLIMRGQLMIESRTCRTRSITLAGPVAMSETRGPAQGRFIVSTNGTLQVSVRARFGQDVRVGKRPSLPAR